AIAAIALIFGEKFRIIRVRLLGDHVVIAGMGRRGLLLAESFLARGVPVVAIERDTDSDWIVPCRSQGGIVIYGDAADQNVLRSAGAHRAQCVIAVCGNDGVNAEIAVNCNDLVRTRRGKPLKCVAQIENLDLCHLLKGLDFSTTESDSFRLQFFNSHIRGARLVIEEHPPYDPVSGDIPHVLIIGIGRMGEYLAVHAAKMWRNLGLNSKGRLRITLVDRNAEEKRKIILLKHPGLETVCRLASRQVDIHSAEFCSGRFLHADDAALSVSIVYVCLDNDSNALAAAFQIRKHLRGRNVPIVVRTMRQSGLSKLFQYAAARNGPALRAFGLLEKTCKPDLVVGGTHEILAQAMYKEHSAGGCLDTIFSAGSIPDSWDDLPDRYKEAYQRRADSICRMLRNVGCTLEILEDWDIEDFAFNSSDEEFFAGSLHECIMDERRIDQVLIPPGFSGTRLDEGLAPISWDLRSDSDKEAYREEIRGFPAFLSRADLHLYRIE
ncbi:MAG: NAD-binding protein, partial [Pseudomonadota bacterium]